MITNRMLHVIVESLPTSGWAEQLSALMTPLIAIIAVYIAFRQFRVDSFRLRHELYERRLRVYRTLQLFLSDFVREGGADYTRTSQFYADASEAAFLFDKAVQDYIDQLYSKAVDARMLHEKLYPRDGSSGLPIGEERGRVSEQNGAILKWVAHQLAESKDLFRKYMAIE